MEIEKRVNEKESRREAGKRGGWGWYREREFYVFEIAFPADSGGKICERYTLRTFRDQFLSSLFQMSKGQEGSEATRIEEGGNEEGGKGKREKKNAKRWH